MVRSNRLGQRDLPEPVEKYPVKLETFTYNEVSGRGLGAPEGSSGTFSGWSMPLPDLDGKQTLVVVLGSPHLIDAPGAIQELVAFYPTSHVVGCSTSGEIHGTNLYDGGLSVAVLKFEHSRISTASAPVDGPEASFEAGASLARQLQDPSLRGVLLFSDGLNVNGTELLLGINSVLDASVVVSGGLAGDGDRFKRTWVLQEEGRPVSRLVVAAGLYGDRLRIGFGNRGGWSIFGPERVVTRLRRHNVLYELDDKPALALYKRYLGDLAEELPDSALLFPLAVRSSQADEAPVVRTILGIDEDAQSMTFAGDIPQGALAQLMMARSDALIDGAAEAADMTFRSVSAQGDDRPMLSIAISCVGRRLVLGERTEEELEAVMDGLPPGTRQIGFYSYGEVSPNVNGAGRCQLHNQTMTLTTLSED